LLLLLLPTNGPAKGLRAFNTLLLLLHRSITHSGNAVTPEARRLLLHNALHRRAATALARDRSSGDCGPPLPPPKRTAAAVLMLSDV
jgi:hypothetical protein